ncbi:MAG: hypothetical protein KAJ15_13225, partial [Spirochaetes bacterium]|nr:hypothetical protein [Spirochaetota bacterium]
VQKITITIPTYWARKSGEIGSPRDSIFDHPTPMDKTGTLPRCLKSLTGLKSHDFQVLIITAPVSPELAGEAEAGVESIIFPFRKHFPIIQFGVSDLMFARESLERQGLDGELLNLNSYPNIRNCQLIGAHVLGSELIAAVDDDEIVPEDFLTAAAEYTGTVYKGKRVDGKAGVYLNREGDFKISETSELRSASNLFIKKACLINDTFSSLLSAAGKIVETSIALGGNMVFSRELFTAVPHDPNITRGEDIDYLINSRMLGFHWFFDRKLFITHLPPGAAAGDPLNTTPLAKMQQDVIRFIYQKEKIRLSLNMAGIKAVRAEELGVYPGEFLKPGVEEQALIALQDKRPPDADESFFPRPAELLVLARRQAEKAGAYFDFAKKWPGIMDILGSDPVMRNHLLRKSGL